MSADVLARVKALIVEQLDVDEEAVTLDADFKTDLGGDSLDIVNLIMAFEDEFDMEIPDEDAENIVTVSNVVDYIQSKK